MQVIVRLSEGPSDIVRLATLISGTDITDAALESARELMATGRQGE
ncbi:MAG: hypothetical protein GVY35_12485 [Bacteroidetes bacterium]|jgi:DNA repair ATPase RecN|nr:hypothetical protein [Bacteroidota bacterium]